MEGAQETHDQGSDELCDLQQGEVGKERQIFTVFCCREDWTECNAEDFISGKCSETLKRKDLQC